MMTSGTLNDWNQPDDEHVDQHEHDRERETEVAEDLDRHLPLAVPLDRGLVEPVAAAPRCSARSPRRPREWRRALCSSRGWRTPATRSRRRRRPSHRSPAAGPSGRALASRVVRATVTKRASGCGPVAVAIGSASSASTDERCSSGEPRHDRLSPSRAVGDAARPAGAPDSARYSVCVICSTLAPASAARTRSTRNDRAAAAAPRRSSRRRPRRASTRRPRFTCARRLEARRVVGRRTPRPRGSRAPAAPAESPRSWPTRRSAARSSRSPGAPRPRWRDSAATIALGDEIHLHVGDVRRRARRK